MAYSGGMNVNATMSPPHAVARLRALRQAAGGKPYTARGGLGPRCPACRLPPTHCLCARRPAPVPTRAGVCLLMTGLEVTKPSNTGWLVADVVPDTWAFLWARTQVDPGLLALLGEPRWQPYVVFPGEFVPPTRTVVQALASGEAAGHPAPGRRPLFVLLDGTWSEARKMFNKSPYLAHLPVLSLAPGKASGYALRRSRRDDHFCTAEVAAMCLAQAGDVYAAALLEAWLDVFGAHYLRARGHLPPACDGEAYGRLQALAVAAPSQSC